MQLALLFWGEHGETIQRCGALSQVYLGYSRQSRHEAVGSVEVFVLQPQAMMIHSEDMFTLILPPRQAEFVPARQFTLQREANE